MSGGEVEKLRRLSQIAALKRDRDSQALAEINAAIGRLQGQVARLRRSVGRRARDLELDPARMAGADVLWVRRTEQQIAAIQAQIARLHVEREGLVAAARLAYGKSLAVDSLRDRAQAELRRKGQASS
jgi:uncharacterized small protein (DUF1192 family)